MNAEAMAETEATHTALVNLFNTLGGVAFSMCVGAFNKRCSTHIDVFKLYSNHNNNAKRLTTAVT